MNVQKQLFESVKENYHLWDAGKAELDLNEWLIFADTLEDAGKRQTPNAIRKCVERHNDLTPFQINRFFNITKSYGGIWFVSDGTHDVNLYEIPEIYFFKHSPLVQGTDKVIACACRHLTTGSIKHSAIGITLRDAVERAIERYYGGGAMAIVTPFEYQEGYEVQLWRNGHPACMDHFAPRHKGNPITDFNDSVESHE